MEDSELLPQPRRLSLIDVSCEDDSLIDSFAGDFKFSDASEDQENRSLELFGGFAASKLEVVPESVELSDQVIEPSESLEPEVKKKKGKKYNLRESLAWDSAFLTDAGVLDSEEISSMMEGDKSQKRMLSGIQEEVCRSTDTISTLESDTLTLESMETNLFEDVRASIQKSSRASYAVDESPKVGSGVTKKVPTSASKGVDHASQDKVASKKLSIDVRKPEILKRQAIRCPQVSRSVSITGDSSKSLSKRSKVLGNPIPSSAASTKRASTGGTLLKMEKDNVKSTTSRRDSVATASFSSRIVPKPRPSSKSATLGAAPATKREVASSSFDRSCPTSSNNTGKSPSNSKSKTDARTDNSPSSGSNFKPAPRIEPRKNIQSGKSFLSSNVLPGTKLHSSISPASSVSEWSSESSRASLDTISLKSGSADFDAAYMVDLPNHVNDVSSLGQETQPTVLLRKSGVKAPGDKNGVLPPTSKPSGLRLPSPKIGFFDGVKSAGSTPKGGNQPHPPIPSSLPIAGTGSVGLSGGQSNGKLEKLQPTRTVTKMGTKKPDSQQVASDMKPKSPIPLQYSSNAAKKVLTSRNNVSPNVESKVPPKSGMENQLKDEQIATEGHGIDIREQDDCSVNRNGSIALSNDNLNPELMGSSIIKPAKVIPIEGDSTSLCDSTSTMDANKIIASEKVIGDAALALHNVKHDVDSLNAFKEREDLQIEEQVHDLSRQVGAMNISAESANACW